ncbi:MAG: hypothetical protein MJ095_08645, partial [Oscillospiraceae bacterium]|nr:hypothetical protein [Oscillospiraceae bacterium]
MKKFILTIITAMITAVSLIGCGNNENTKADNTTAIVATALSANGISTQNINYTYTTKDVNNLQDFLLGRETSEDLKNKPYDMDNDGVWNIFDLCMMKHKIIYPDKESNDTIVVYFSRTNNTEKIADYIIDYTDADSYEIEAAVPYTDEDIEYSNSSCRANKEQNDKTVRPEIAEPIDSLEQYDVIYLGYPIWWGEEPRIIDTFLESYDFSDKTVIPFCTSHSSGISTSEKNIAGLVSIGNQLDGKRFSASATQEEVEKWVDELNVKEDDMKTGVF